MRGEEGREDREAQVPSDLGDRRAIVEEGAERARSG